MSNLNSPTVENEQIFTAFNCFLKKLKNDDWISHASKEEIKNCLFSAKSVENMFEMLEINSAVDSFIVLVPNLFGLDRDQLHNACDIVLAMVLTAPGTSLPCVRTCIDQYFQLCGPGRFEKVLSSVIFCSEIYRILLDYLASFEGSLEQVAIELHSHIFVQVWKTETDSEILKINFLNWLESDASGQNIAVALQVLLLEDGDIASSLVFTLMKILQKREDTAVTFWSIVKKLPFIRKALERSDDLVNSLFKFLETSALWMEATATFTWVSREKGPCGIIGFEELSTAVKCLLETPGPISKKTQRFLAKRKNSEGCTFWDDIEMGLNCCI